ncbi:unnamed protein product [marine sediment metagenome]|uniref:HTH luxR-type domain-containing protein n=1 Tax=marine sediment metagenome TaxID=412755 RepID=X0XT06_9ZZZZ
MLKAIAVKKIARKLNISFYTVKSHREHIFEKLSLHSVSDLTRYAYSNEYETKAK